VKQAIVRGRKVQQAAPVAPAQPVFTVPLLLLIASFVLAIWAYSPALHGEFVFDDLHLPFLQPGAGVIPLVQWLGVRPLLMFTYWVNLHWAGVNPYSYHCVNLFFHFLAGTLLYFIIRKILALAGFADSSRTMLAALCAAVFLLHPMQTEAVTYVAQRGESMGAMFFFAAWCLFLYRRPGEISWPTALSVLALYGAAVATKEHTVTLPAVLLLTDHFFHPEARGFGGLRRNWKLYLPIVIGAALASLFVVRYISRDTVSIGFGLKEFTWYQYLFTEWRVFFVYLGKFALPLWQTVDYDFSISHTPLDHGSLIALLVILTLVTLAIVWRKRYPLASFGFLIFLLMLLPTSSVIPIKDVVADRRLYLPMIGLLLVCAEFLQRFRYKTALTAVLMLVLATSTWARNQVWASSMNLWEDAAQKAPGKQRVQFGLAVAQFRAGRCKEAVEHYARAAEIEKPDYTLLMNWSLAYECNHQPDQAIAKMRESLQDKPSAQAWASMGVLYARQGKVQEAMDALMRGQVMDPTYPVTYLYRARIHQAMNQIPEARQNLKAVLDLDPTNETALQMMQQLKGQPR